MTGVDAGLRPMTEDEVATYVAGQLGHYIGERIGMGEEPDQARSVAEDQFARLFPDGKPAPGQLVYRVLDDAGTDVGTLWIGPREPERPEKFWVWYVEIDEVQRGRGLGRAAMLLAEREARAHAATELGLNVFGHNTVARQLYESIGYEPTTINMRKRL